MSHVKNATKTSVLHAKDTTKASASWLETEYDAFISLKEFLIEHEAEIRCGKVHPILSLRTVPLDRSASQRALDFAGDFTTYHHNGRFGRTPKQRYISSWTTPRRTTGPPRQRRRTTTSR